MKVLALVAIIALISVANGWISTTHDIHGAASKCIYDGIKYEL